MEGKYQIAVYRIKNGLGYTFSESGIVKDSLFFSDFKAPDEYYANAIKRKLDEIRRVDGNIETSSIVVNSAPNLKDIETGLLTEREMETLLTYLK